jgi:hypothetical protein
MQQKEKIGTATKVQPQGPKSTGPAEEIKTPGAGAPDVIRPRCVSSYCTERRDKGEKRKNGEPIGDPLEVMRLRYDFPDGVVAETLFCADCRGMINATLYGFDRTIAAKNPKPAAAAVPEPPAA